MTMLDETNSTDTSQLTDSELLAKHQPFCIAIPYTALESDPNYPEPLSVDDLTNIIEELSLFDGDHRYDRVWQTVKITSNYIYSCLREGREVEL